jgi:hypothetical protein
MSALPVIVELDFEKAELANRDELREMIFKLEETLKQAPQIEMPELTSFLSWRLWSREIPIPVWHIAYWKNS